MRDQTDPLAEPIPDFAKADPGRELYVSFRSSTQVLASVIVGLRNEGPAGTSAEVDLCERPVLLASPG
jgi:hypothetical protein